MEMPDWNIKGVSHECSLDLSCCGGLSGSSQLHMGGASV